MKNPLCAFIVPAVLALLLTSGGVHAQLKAPAKPSSRAPLGSGLYIPPAEPPQSAAPSAEPAASVDSLIQDIANCVISSLPPNWVLAQIEVIELGRDEKNREFEAKYSYVGPDGKDVRFAPCDLREPALNVYKLNGALEPSKRNWKKATLVLSSEGKFELKYDYAKDETSAKPAEAGSDKAATKDEKPK